MKQSHLSRALAITACVACYAALRMAGIDDGPGWLLFIAVCCAW